MKIEELIKVYDTKEETFRDSSGRVEKTEVTLFVETPYRKFESKGIATVDKKDLDLSTQATGSHIAHLKASILSLEKVGKMKEVTKEEKEELSQATSDLKKELEAFIDRKQKFFSRIRDTRNGDYSNKIRVFAKSEDGKKAIEITNL